MASARDVLNPPSLIIAQGSGNPFTFTQTSETITGTVDPDPIGFRSFGVPGGYSGGVYLAAPGIEIFRDCVVLAPLLHNVITIFNPYSGVVVADIDISSEWMKAGNFPLYAATDPTTVFPYTYLEEEGKIPPETSAYALQTFKRFSGAVQIPDTHLVVFSPASWFFEGDYARWSSNEPPWTYVLLFGVLDLSDLSFQLIPIDLSDLNDFVVPDKYTKKLFNIIEAQKLSATAPRVNKSRLTVFGSSSGEVFIPGKDPSWLFPGVRDPFSIDGNPRSPSVIRKIDKGYQIFQAGGSGLLAMNNFAASQLCVAVALEYDGKNWTSKVYQQYATETPSNVLLSQVCWSACGVFDNDGKYYIAPQFVKRQGFVPFEPAGSSFGASRLGALQNVKLGATLGTKTILGAAELVVDDVTKSAVIVYKTGLATLTDGPKSALGVPSIGAGVVGYNTSRGLDSAIYTEILSLDTIVMDTYEEGELFALPALPTLVSENTQDTSKIAQFLVNLNVTPTVASTTISFAPESVNSWAFEVGHPLTSGCSINTDSVVTNSPTFTPAPPGFYSFENQVSSSGDDLPFSLPLFDGSTFFLTLQQNIRRWMVLVKADPLSEIEDILRFPNAFFLYHMQGNPIPLKERGFVYTPCMSGQLSCVYDPYAKPRNVIIGSDLEIQRARLFTRPTFIVDEATSRKTLSATRIYKPVAVSRPSSMQKCGQVFRLEQRRFPTATDKSIIPCYFRGQQTTQRREATTPDYGAITPLALGVDQGGSADYLVPYNPRSKQRLTHKRIIIDSNATTRFFPSDSKDGQFIIKSETTDLFKQAIVDANGQSQFDRPTGL